MLRIDPHTRSARSDNTDSPSQLMIEVVWVGLGCVGLSDHDTFTGWDEAEAATSSTGIALVRGVETSCAANGISVYLPTLLPDLSNEGPLTCIERAHKSRTTRVLKMVESLSADYPITWEQVLAFAPEEGPTGCPHIADALVVVGAFDDRPAVFVRVLHSLNLYYVHHWAPDPIEAIQLVLEAEGVPILIHPKAHARQRLLPESTIEDMKEVDLFGIEHDHHDHAPENREAMDRIAKRLDLQVFGSSDYHGTGKLSRIGKDLTIPAIIDETVECTHLEVLHP